MSHNCNVNIDVDDFMLGITIVVIPVTRTKLKAFFNRKVVGSNPTLCTYTQGSRCVKAVPSQVKSHQQPELVHFCY